MTRQLKKACAVVLALTGALSAAAVPALRQPISYTQPDGSVVTLTPQGDEYGHWYTDAAGNIVVSSGDSYVYADVDAAGQLSLTGVRAGQMVPQGLNREATLRALVQRNSERRAVRAMQPRQVTMPGATVQQRMPSGSAMLISDIPTTGQQTGLVVLVEYTDVKFSIDNPREYFQRFMMEEGFSEEGATGSARDFFLASSRGLYDPDFEVFGPVALSRNRAYYGANSGYSQDDMRPEEMAIEAVQALDDKVDFSRFDTDGDGFIDNITVIYAGPGEASGGPAESVWPHAWYVYNGAGRAIRADGVYLDRYNVINERIGNRTDGIGTFVHEFSHVLGLPDLYATNYSNASTLDEWSVMDYGPYNNDGRTPPLHSAYEAYCLGWVTPERMVNNMNGVLDGTGSGQSYYAQTSRPNEFFIFEYRSQEGWDAYLPAEGMIVTHVDYNASTWRNNTLNNNASHQGVDLVEASGNERNKQDAAFPGNRGSYTEFTYDTNPAFQSWSRQDLGMPVTEITLDSDNGILTFKVGDGTAAIDAPVATEAPTTTEEGTTLSWEPVEVAASYELRIYNADAELYEPGMRCLVVPAASLQGTRAEAVSYTVTGLTPDTNYLFSVRAVTSTTRSEYTDPVAFKTEVGEEPDDPDEPIDGIDDVEAGDNTPVFYYDLQGRPVERPTTGVYIRRQGTTVSKIVIL